MQPDLSPAEKTTVIFFGMTASGKSFLARNWSNKHNFPYFNTDVVRKRLIAAMDSQPAGSGINSGIYSQEFTSLTYETLIESAQDALTDANDQTVVLDGSYIKQQHRDKLRAALNSCCRYVFVYCYCSEEVTKKRLALREKDDSAVSDGTWEVYLHQRKMFEPPTELNEDQLLELDTNKPIAELINELDEKVL